MLSRVQVEGMEIDHDEGELNSDEDSRTSTSEGFTTDGEDDSSDVRLTKNALVLVNFR